MITRTRATVGALGVLVVALGAATALQREARGKAPAPAAHLTTPAAAAPAAVGRAVELSEAFVAVAASVTPAVVRIQAEQTAPPEGWLPRRLQDFFGPSRDTLDDPPPRISGGTGFIVSETGLILTNNHVVEGADRILVALSDKRTFEATLVGRDPTTDIAVIRIEAEGLPAVRLGDSDAARVGEWVVAIGNPGFAESNTLDFTVTSGIISAKGRPLNIIPQELATAEDAGFAIEDFIQTDAVINPGNSGGPLVDLDGEVIGINTAIASTTGYSQGYGFAIPANLAREVMSDLVEYGHVRRALLGVSISDVNAEDAEVYGLDSISGVLVEDFAAGGPARNAGLQRHDVIVAVDGVAVDRVSRLQRLIAQREPGERVLLEVVRYGEHHTLEVELGEAPITHVGPAPRLAARSGDPTGLGLEVADLTPVLARRFGFDRAGGVVVEAITPYGAAHRKRIGSGHRIIAIDRTNVSNAREARALLRRVRSGEVVSLLLETPQGRTYIANVRVP